MSEIHLTDEDNETAGVKNWAIKLVRRKPEYEKSCTKTVNLTVLFDGYSLK